MRIDARDQKLLNHIAQIIYDKKGTNIISLDVREVSTLTEYFVIAEGNVERHVAAIARALLDEREAFGISLFCMEGLSNGDWVVLDFGHIIVHLFKPELRELYALERIWNESSIVDLKLNLKDTR
jgi:ribosome-associated protein